MVLHLEALDIRFADDDVGVATKLWSLGFNVSEGLGYAKSTREDSQWALHVQVLLSGHGSSFGESLGSVDLASCSLDSDLLKFIVWLVISR